jgi:hypothetical protein
MPKTAVAGYGIALFATCAIALAADDAAIAAKREFWRCEEARIPAETGCRIVVAGIDELFETYSELGVTHPHGQLETKPWGRRGFRPWISMAISSRFNRLRSKGTFETGLPRCVVAAPCLQWMWSIESPLT